MARYDVYANLDGVGYLLDVQADILDQLSTRVVVPLLPKAEAPRPAARLNPIFDIAGEPVIMASQFMAAIPASALKQRVTRLDSEHQTIVSALDMLLQGF